MQFLVSVAEVGGFTLHSCRRRVLLLLKVVLMLYFFADSADFLRETFGVWETHSCRWPFSLIDVALCCRLCFALEEALWVSVSLHGVSQS